jgi:hypothetical protein
VPLGEDVVPAPSQTRVATIQRVIDDLQRLGPVARYESLRRLRAAYDGPAKAAYNAATTTEYQRLQGEKLGAQDVTGVLRDQVAQLDTGARAETATANADYHLGAAAGALAGQGEPTASGVGIGAGYLIGPVVDQLVDRGPTVKIAAARLLAQFADAVRGRRPEQVASVRAKLARLAGLAVGPAGRPHLDAGAFVPTPSMPPAVGDLASSQGQRDEER